GGSGGEIGEGGRGGVGGSDRRGDGGPVTSQNHVVSQRRRPWPCVEWDMKLAPPDIPEHERTPLVLLLLDIIHQQQQRIAQLEHEIATLKGLKPRPTLQPSTLEAPPPQAPAPPPKRPGSDKRHKTAQLTIHREAPVPLPPPPPRRPPPRLRGLHRPRPRQRSPQHALPPRALAPP